MKYFPFSKSDRACLKVILIFVILTGDPFLI